MMTLDFKKIMIAALLVLLAVGSFTLAAPWAADPLITLSGYITFMFLIPLACLLVAVAILFGKTNFTRTAAKITLIGLIIFMIVPASVTLSDMVYRTRADKVDQTIEECNDLELVGDSDKGLLNELTTITTNTVDKITSFLDNLLESLAVMIVTSCIIPLLVFAFLIWLVKIIFSANAPVIDSSVIDAITARR